MLHRFLSDRRGTTAIEYALVAVLVSVAIVIAVRSVGQNLLIGFYQPAAAALSSAAGP